MWHPPSYLCPKPLFSAFAPLLHIDRQRTQETSCRGYYSRSGYVQPSVVQGQSSPYKVLITPTHYSCSLSKSTVGTTALDSSFPHPEGHHTPYPDSSTLYWPVKNVLSSPARKLLLKGQQPFLFLFQSPTLEPQLMNLSLASAEGHPSSLSLRHWGGAFTGPVGVFWQLLKQGRNRTPGCALTLSCSFFCPVGNRPQSKCPKPSSFLSVSIQLTILTVSHSPNWYYF